MTINIQVNDDKTISMLGMNLNQGELLDLIRSLQAAEMQLRYKK